MSLDQPADRSTREQIDHRGQDSIRPVAVVVGLLVGCTRVSHVTFLGCDPEFAGEEREEERGLRVQVLAKVKRTRGVR